MQFCAVILLVNVSFADCFKKENLIFVLRSFTRQVFTKHGVNLAVPIFEYGFNGLFNVVL